MSSEGRGTRTTCPTCGEPVIVYNDDEGSHVESLGASEVERLEKRLEEFVAADKTAQVRIKEVEEFLEETGEVERLREAMHKALLDHERVRLCVDYERVRLCVDSHHPIDPGNYEGPIHCTFHSQGTPCVTALYQRVPQTTGTAEERQNTEPSDSPDEEDSQ